MHVDEVMGHSAANVLGAGGMEANGANSDLNGLESIHTYLRNLESGRVANDAPYYPFFESYGTREETTLEETLEAYGASMQTHGNKELKEAWVRASIIFTRGTLDGTGFTCCVPSQSALVRDSAKSVGRANSNIKRYLGDAVVSSTRHFDRCKSHAHFECGGTICCCHWWCCWCWIWCWCRWRGSWRRWGGKVSAPCWRYAGPIPCRKMIAQCCHGSSAKRECLLPATPVQLST